MNAILLRDQDIAVAQRDHLRRNLKDVVAAAADIATDDAHDPDGATIAHERPRMTAFLEQADARPAAIAAVLDGSEDGTPGGASSAAARSVPIGSGRGASYGPA
jgi:DnaK suppressor protein